MNLAPITRLSSVLFDIFYCNCQMFNAELSRKRSFLRCAHTSFVLSPESTHLLLKGKYHCATDLLFDWFACVELDRDLKVWWNPNQSNRRSAVQQYFPLQSK